MRTFGLALALVCTAHAACVQAPGGHILFSDIARLLPTTGAEQPPSSFIGWTPAPGVRRVLTSAELLRFAGAHGVSLREQEVRDICVERSTTPLNEQIIREAIARIPELAGVDVELIDFLRIQVPNGTLEFSVANLPQPPRGDFSVPVTWRGRFAYDDRRTLAVWAKVKLSRARITVRAVRKIPAGAEITADMLDLVCIREFPGREQRRLLSISHAVGRKALRALQAGDELDDRGLAEVELIGRGENVRVTVQSGGIRLTLEREAVSAGQLGRVVLLRDKSSGKVLRAVTDGKGTAVIHLSGENRS